MPRLPVLLCACAITIAQAGADVLVTDAENQRVVRLDGHTGQVLDPTFIDLAPFQSLPWQATQVGQEVWVTEIFFGDIQRFSLDGDTWLGSIDVGPVSTLSIDYVESINRAFVATTGSGGRGFAIVDTTNNTLESWSPTRYSSNTVLFDGDKVIGSALQQDSLWAYQTDGTDLGEFSNTLNDAGLQTPTQMAWMSDGSFLVACSGDGPNNGGIAQYNTEGDVLRTWSIPTGPFGVGLMDSGNILFTDVELGVYMLDPDTGATTPIDIGPGLPSFVGTLVPAPGPVALALPIGLAACRRRR